MIKKNHFLMVDLNKIGIKIYVLNKFKNRNLDLKGFLNQK